MKDKIKRAIDKHVFEVADKLCGLDDAADEITALMCYLEVRAFMNGIIYVNQSISAEEVVDCFVDTYQRELVVAAIEQIKNEQK